MPFGTGPVSPSAVYNGVAQTRASSGAGVPSNHATYQIVLPIIYVYCFKGKFMVRADVDG